MDKNTSLTENDVGKRVVNANGDVVGRVVDVEPATAHIDPHPTLSDTAAATFGWSDCHPEDTYRLNSEQVDEITADEVRLRS